MELGGMIDVGKGSTCCWTGLGGAETGGAGRQGQMGWQRCAGRGGGRGLVDWALRL